MRTLLILFSFQLFSLSLYSQSSELESFTSNECHFTAIIPENPDIRKDSLFAQGQMIKTIEYTSWTKKAVAYSVSCSDFPAAHLFDSPKKTFNMLKSGAAQSVGGKLENMTSIKINDHEGISYVEKSDDFTVYNWILLIDKKIFQMYVSGMNHDAKKEATAFFESFKINSK